MGEEKDGLLKVLSTLTMEGCFGAEESRQPLFSFNFPRDLERKGRWEREERRVVQVSQRI